MSFLYLPFLRNDWEDDIPKFSPALNNLKVDNGDNPVNLPFKGSKSKKKKILLKIKSKF